MSVCIGGWDVEGEGCMLATFMSVPPIVLGDCMDQFTAILQNRLEAIMVQNLLIILSIMLLSISPIFACFNAFQTCLILHFS